MRRFGVLVLCMFMAGTVFATGQSEENKTILSLMVPWNSGQPVINALEEVIADFHVQNPTINVEMIPGSTEYEAIMKSKMATNDLPDMWATHGWSVIRYSEYLTALENESWASKLHPAIKPVITDSEGHIYVLPIDVEVAGVAYNKTILAKAGIKVEDLRTWKDLFAAMEKIKSMGITPVHIGGKDSWTVGNFLDWSAPAVYVTDPDNSSAKELLGGTFDIAKWEILSNLMKEMNEKDYLNVDNLTSTFSDSARALAVGDAAFGFYGNYVLTEAWTYDPDADLGFFPVPAYFEGDSPSLISGERTTIGIWKDTKNAEACKAFLDFVAQPENIAKIAESNGIPAGLTDAVADMGKLEEDYKRWAHSSAFPYFDRAFLPSGMWDTMCSTGAGILSRDMTPKEAATKMAEDFNRLYK